MLDTIEDALETLAGLRSSNKFEIEKEEFTIMNSIARQVFRGTALTDRQFVLMKEKLQKYIPQFVAAGYTNVEIALDELRQPLRQIDRTRYVKIVDSPDYPDIDEDTSGKFIAVRFPFKKSDIMRINDIKKTEPYYHSKGSHIHYFALTETYLLEVGNNFFNKDYEIDELLIEKYKQVKEIKDNPNRYLPTVINGKITNISNELSNIIEQETNGDLLKILDRRFRYCLDEINIKVNQSSLQERIASRLQPAYHSKPSKELTSDVLHSLFDLDRYPMLVILDSKDAENQLHEVVNFYRDLIPYEQQSVLFRDEESDSGFNQLIRQRKLNNWVDKDTKIVYISNNALPKVLLESDWKPICAFTFESNNNKNVQMYIKNNCDLIVYREETISPFLRLYN